MARLSLLSYPQEKFGPGTSVTDAYILCTALGGDHEIHPRYVGCVHTEFVIVPPRNCSTECAYIIVSGFLPLCFLAAPKPEHNTG